jgi:predicted dinucleotide-binding enzyme
MRRIRWHRSSEPAPDPLRRNNPFHRRVEVGVRIGLIGSGRIGGTLARLAVDRGHEVVLSNSRGPASLRDLVDQLGSRARAGTVVEAAAGGDVVVVTIPLKAYRDVPAAELAGKIVIDTNNYYPTRDGRIPELEDGSTTSSELLAAHLGGAKVVKAFNTILFTHLATQGQPPGTPDRRALPIAGDDPDAKRVVAQLIDQFGFDVVDTGPLAEGRRFQPDTPPYNVRLDATGLRSALARA